LSARRSRRRDPVRLEVFHHLFAAACEEMGTTLMHSSFSPNIKERRDFSCALFDRAGRMIAQAAHLPVHLGSTPLCVQAAIAAAPMGRGDSVILNDHFLGGTHLPDVTFVTPVFLSSAAEPDFYCANRAHHADVGGHYPGSMAPSADIHGEGIRIPPTTLVKGGEIDHELLRLLLANMRVPAEREGDLLAQWSANRLGARRLEEMATAYGAAEVHERAAGLVDWTAALLRAVVGDLPRGEWSFEDELEEPGPGGANARIRLTMRRDRRGLELDFRATDDQVAGPVNTTRAVVVSAVFYVLRLLLPPETPSNDGVLRDVRILTREGSLVDARYPAAVAAGNVETSQRLVDVLLGALARALPGRIPAASAGTMSNVTFGAQESPTGPAFTYYETIGGGAGGGPAGPGAHALQTHMTNTLNTPVEAIETHIPVRLVAHTVRRDSGGAGAAAGGDGIVKRFRFLADVRAGWVAERQLNGPWGADGGAPGQPGSASYRRAGDRRDRRLAGKATISLEAGSELELRTPGGGGYGPPR